MMDDEWILDGPDSIEWWPSLLPMTISVIQSGTFSDSGENFLRVSATTELGRTDEQLGIELASKYHRALPVGAVVYADGALRLTTIYCFGPRNRSLLTWFKQALLIQSSAAIQLARDLNEVDGVEVQSRMHPITGFRSDVDDLVKIYGVDSLIFAIDDGVVGHYNELRPRLRDLFVNTGYSPGFSNDEVDFYNLGFAADEPGALQRGGFDFGIGFMRGTDLEKKIGPFLRIMARILPPGSAFDMVQTAYANEDLCDLDITSVFGFISGPESADGGSCLVASVPYLTLLEWSKLGDDAFVYSVANAAFHVVLAAQRFRHDVLGIEWPQN